MSLRQGLESLGKSPEETQTFFDALLKLHEPVLRLRRVRARAEGLAPGTVDPEIAAGREVLETLLAPASPEQQKPKSPERPWIGARELASAGFSETMPLTGTGSSDAPDTGEAALEPDEPAEALVEPTEVVLNRLTTGGWVDLFSGGEWLRAQLVWSSQKASLFMFTSQGGRAHTMTRRSCEKLMAKRWLRLVEARPVMDRALRQLTAAAAEATAEAQ
jgi:hypothetical protein